MEWALALVALALLGVPAVSRWLSGTPVTPPTGPRSAVPGNSPTSSP
jgi:hypothetical protein